MKFRPFLLLRYLFTISLFGLIFWCFRDDWEQGFHSFTGLDLRLFALAIPMVAVHYLLKAWKWQQLLRRRGVRVGYGLAMRSLLAGIAMSLFTPLNLGELGRVLYLPGRSRSTLAGLVLVDKALDLTAVFLFAVPGTLLMFGGWWALLPAAAALAALSVLALGPTMAVFFRRCYWLGPVRARAVRAALAAARVGPGAAFLLLLVALLAFFVIYLLYFILLHGLLPDANLRLGQVMTVVPLVMAGRLVPLTVSGLGAREWIAALLFPGIGVTQSVAVEVTLLVFLLTSACPALIGVLTRPRGRVRAALLVLLLAGAAGPAAAADYFPLGGSDKEGSIPREYFPRFRDNQQVEQMVQGYRQWLEGEREEALVLFEAAAAAEPDNYQPLKLLAHAYMETGRLADARTALERALGLFPHDSWNEEACRRSKEDVSHIVWLAGLYRESGESNRQLKCYRKAVKMDPHNEELHQRMAEIYEERGEMKKAFEAYAETVRRDPGRCDLLVRLVELSAQLERPEEDLRRYLRDALRCDRSGMFLDRLDPWLHLAPPDLLPGADDETSEAEKRGGGEIDGSDLRPG